MEPNGTDYWTVPIHSFSPNEAESSNETKKEWKWQKGITTYPLSESQWLKSHLIVQKWESRKHKGCGFPGEGFRDHVTTDGSLLGVPGKWCACGWSVVQLGRWV